MEKSTTHSDSNEEVDLQTYFTILSANQSQIQFADRKAGFMVAMNALMFGFASASTGRLYGYLEDHNPAMWFWVVVTVFVLYGVAATLSTGICIWTVMPRFGDEAPASRTYFGHIVREYGNDAGKYFRDTKSMNESAWASDVATQIVEVSNIALTKHKNLTKAAWVLLPAFLFWVAGLVSMFFL